jgi:hypothetical protein
MFRLASTAADKRFAERAQAVRLEKDEAVLMFCGIL